MNFNKVILMGHLVQDPQCIRKNEKVTAKYTLAVGRKLKREGDPETDFFDCVTFHNMAEAAVKYLSKGSELMVVGHLQITPYTDKNGNKARSIQVVVEEQIFGNNKKREKPSVPEDSYMTEEEMESMPFR